MKIVLAVFIFWSVSASSAHASRIGESFLGTVDAWSEWFAENQEVDSTQVCAQVLARYQHTNRNRPYEGELETPYPVGFKAGTNVDGLSYFALSCRLRVYRAPLQKLF